MPFIPKLRLHKDILACSGGARNVDKMMEPLPVDEVDYHKANRFLRSIVRNYSRQKIIFQDGRPLRPYSLIEIRGALDHIFRGR